MFFFSFNLIFVGFLLFVFKSFDYMNFFKWERGFEEDNELFFKVYVWWGFEWMIVVLIRDLYLYGWWMEYSGF